MKLKLFFLAFILAIQVKSQTVVDIIVNSPVHNTLEAAVGAAGLASTLSGKGPFTIFAPTDEAFNALPPGTVQSLLADPQGALTKVLTYHVLASKTKSGFFSSSLTTINGKTLNIKRSGNSIFVNNAKITVRDINAVNGVVHVIDAVLIPPTTVMDIIENSNVHNTLEAALKAAKLTRTLSGNGSFTVFAPTDAAFNALPAGTVSSLLANPQALTRILLYHVLNNEMTSSSFFRNDWIQTINGKYIVVKLQDGNIFIDNAKVIVKDIVTENGVVHVIDAVMLPSTTVADILVKSPIHNTLVAAATQADLVTTLQGKGPFTVFAPTDKAFQALPNGTIEALLSGDNKELTSILLYHILGNRTSSFGNGNFLATLNGKSLNVRYDGSDVFIDNAKLVIRDLKADNGVVHVIDAVMLPPNNVVDVIVKSPTHNTLEAAVSAAGLIPTLTGKGPFTVFAPTDRAFKALPSGTIEALLSDPQGALKRILTFHVSPDRYKSSDLNDGQYIKTVNGQSLLIKVNHSGVFINNARVTVANIMADNGIVHVIDAVMVPTKSVVDIVVNSPVLNTLETAVKAAGLVPVLNGAGPFTIFAPTDKAFSAIPASTLKSLLKNPTALGKILTYHAVAGTALSKDLKDNQFIETINGKSVTVTFKNGGIFINNARVSIADIIAENGVVHIIDAVMLPPIDIVDVIVKSPIHNTLEKAVIAAGLVPTLKGAGPFTVFAPTDRAFEALPAGTLTALINNIPELTKILTYHVTSGKVKSTDLSNDQIINMVGGKNATVKIEGNKIFINNAQVTIANVQADNGIIHVIDAILIPSSNLMEDIATNRSSKQVKTNIYPNPFVNELNIDYSDYSKEKANCTIYDQIGRVVYNNKITPSTTLNLEGLQGALIIKISNADFNTTQQIISASK